MTPNQEKALRKYLNETIIPLIEDVLAKKLGQALDFVATEIAPPKRKEWVGLTEDEVENLMNATGIFGGLTPDEIALARAIEAKLKEKNT